MISLCTIRARTFSTYKNVSVAEGSSKITFKKNIFLFVNKIFRK